MKGSPLTACGDGGNQPCFLFCWLLVSDEADKNYVPIVDVGPLLGGTAQEQSSLAEQIRRWFMMMMMMMDDVG